MRAGLDTDSLVGTVVGVLFFWLVARKTKETLRSMVVMTLFMSVMFVALMIFAGNELRDTFLGYFSGVLLRIPVGSGLCGAL